MTGSSLGPYEIYAPIRGDGTAEVKPFRGRERSKIPC
jgi:hypothetical protein